MKRAAIALLALLSACGEDETIRVYSAPKEPTWRMIAALVPAGDATWFFKVAAASAKAAPRRAEIEGFLGGLKVEGGDVRWTLPAGWKEEKGPGDRVATLAFGDLELSVTKLAGTAGGPLANINRWRNQLGLPALAEGELATHSVPLAGGGLRIDFEGPKKPSMGAPMAAPAPPPPPPPAPPEHGEDLDAVRSLLAYSIPTGWTVNPRPGPMRLLELRAGAAVVSLTYLQGDAGGLVPNVNRWRGQVGLGPLDPAAAPASVKPFEFLGGDGHYVEIEGGEKAMLVVFRLG
ncbi:MAG TPA: hypothetical protein VF950_13470, partial [Planctomycetota bacterium]